MQLRVTEYYLKSGVKLFTRHSFTIRVSLSCRGFTVSTLNPLKNIKLYEITKQYIIKFNHQN
jgi:hypothetical protein